MKGYAGREALNVGVLKSIKDFLFTGPIVLVLNAVDMRPMELSPGEKDSHHSVWLYLLARKSFASNFFI